MTQSITAIANRALQLVGATSIANLADNTPEAREVSRAYDACRHAELRAHTWSFAIARAALAADTEPPTFGARYRYALPADCLRVLVDRTTPQRLASNRPKHHDGPADAAAGSLRGRHHRRHPV